MEAPDTAPSGTTTPAPLSTPVKAVLGAVALTVVALLLWPASGKGPEPGGFLLDPNGRPSPMGARLAPVTLLHFWATWCPPCIQEVPAIERLGADLANQHDFALLMVAVADRREKVDRFLGPSAAPAVLYDPSWDVAHRYGTSQIPETYLVVRGKVVEKFVGATDWDSPAVRKRILSHLGETAPKPRG